MDNKVAAFLSVENAAQASTADFAANLTAAPALPALQINNPAQTAGKMRPRLPGLARRRHTFDAFIRRRVTNLISAKKRKNFYARQRSPRPTFRQKFAGSQAREESTRVARKSMNQLQKAAKFTYLPQRARQLVRRGELAN